MLETPWVPVLTVVFLLTGFVCVGALVIRRRAVAREEPFSDEDLVDINHGVMSAAMILMVWVMVDGPVAWAQVAIFAILGLALVPVYRRAGRRSDRADLVSHAAMDVAMIWMLAAMPTLMSEMGLGGGGGHSHGGGGVAGTSTPTPAWADVLNIAFVVLAAATALWWLYRTATKSRHRLHSLSYSVMAAGMGTMLVLMNV